MALKDADLFVVLDSTDSTNKKVRADALTTFVTGGANVQSVAGGAGIEAVTTNGAVAVSADINTNRGLAFTGTGDDREIAVSLGTGLAFDANGAIQVSNQTLNFSGTVDLTDAGTIPAGAVAVGDAYVNNGNGDAVVDWANITTDLDTGDAVVGTDLVVCTTAGTGAAARYVFIHTGGGAGTVNLAQGTRTATEVPITNTGGDDATLTAATTALAGVMTAADKTKLDGITLDTDGNVNEVEVNLSRARTATTNTVECDAGDDVELTAAEPSTNGAGGFAGLLTATDKEKLDELGAGATIVSMTAQNGVQNTGTATEPVLEANFGAVAAGNTATTVMPYDISLLADI
jgi:hypothetical protein